MSPLMLSQILEDLFWDCIHRVQWRLSRPNLLSHYNLYVVGQRGILCGS